MIRPTRPRSRSTCLRMAGRVAGVVAASLLLVRADAGPIDEALAGGNIPAGQKAIALLAADKSLAADRKFLALFDRYLAGTLPAGLWLDLFEAAAQRQHPELKARLAAHEKKLAESRDPLARYRDCLKAVERIPGVSSSPKCPRPVACAAIGWKTKAVRSGRISR